MRVYNSSTVTNVVRDGDRIDVEASLVSTGEEASAWIRCGVSDLVIESGGFEVYRSPETPGVFGDLSALAGIQAYMGSGAAIREALAGGVPGTVQEPVPETVQEPVQELVQELVFECVRAIVQAETFFITERGYADKAAYDRYWDESYAGSCLLYLNHNHARSWMGYVGGHERRHNLNNRVQSVSIDKNETGYQVDAAFIESFHEISIHLSVGFDGVVTGADSSFIRAPGETCKQTAELISGFIGLSLPALSKKDIARVVGGSGGCAHLTDLVARAALSYASST